MRESPRQAGGQVATDYKLDVACSACVWGDPGAQGATLDVCVAQALMGPGPVEPVTCLSR